MTPDQIAKNGSEHAIQSALFAWAAVAQQHGFEIADEWAAGKSLNPQRQGLPAIPELRWLHAVPNGGSRGDNEKSRKIRGGQMKAEGLRDGVADIFWPVPRFPFPGLYIEMKRLKGGRVSPEQTEWMDALRAERYAVAVCQGWAMASDVITEYLKGGGDNAVT